MMEPDRVNYVTVETNFASVKEPIKPIPLEIKLNEQKVALGKKLFDDSEKLIWRWESFLR